MRGEKILLHACCGPCSTHVWQELLLDYDTVTPFFYNPNIQPQPEYEMRLHAMDILSQKLGKPFLFDNTGKKEWALLTKTSSLEPEGGERCRFCIKFRLEQTIKKAKIMNYDAVTTTLTVSRHKNSAMIFELGSQLSHQYQIPFLEIDFKKKNGTAISNRLAKEWGLYRQIYCGCLYSKKKDSNQK